MNDISQTIDEARYILENSYPLDYRLQDMILNIVQHEPADIFWLLEIIATDMARFIANVSREFKLDAKDLAANRDLSKLALNLASMLSLSSPATFKRIFSDAKSLQRRFRSYTQRSAIPNNHNLTNATNIISTIVTVLDYLDNEAGFVITFPEIQEITANTLTEVVLPFIYAIEEIDLVININEYHANFKRNLQISEISTHSPLEISTDNLGGILSYLFLALISFTPHGKKYINQYLGQMEANRVKTLAETAKFAAEAEKTIAEKEKIIAETKAIELSNRESELVEVYARLSLQPEKVDQLADPIHNLMQQKFTIQRATPVKPTTLPK